MGNSSSPVVQEQFSGFPGDKDAAIPQQQIGIGMTNPHEITETEELPRYAEELEGSLGVKRHELPVR
ncbi:hypothetical protein ABVK25_008766 [Lepraria finkii]|uniref:Uncharacterized protein n=1 Tax=Lepraria finkii TaxID=1340010 RepID=A0ABR4AZE4_9LECA